MSDNEHIHIDNSSKSGASELDTIGQVDPENATYFHYANSKGEEFEHLIRYPEVSYTENFLLEEDLPGIFHSSFTEHDFYFADRIDQFAVIDSGKKALFVDVGLYDFCGVDFLDGALELTNTPWKDVEVFITHSHDDHDGNVIYCLNKGAKHVYMGKLRPTTPEMVDEFLKRTGIARLCEKDLYFWVNRLLTRESQFSGYEDRITYVEAGDVFDVGPYHFEVIETPGHTLEHVCLLDKEKGLLFAGDHVLETAPGMMTFYTDVHLLQRFLESFKYLKTLDLNRVFMCHRDPLVGTEEINAFLEAVIRSYDRPVKKMFDLVEVNEPLTIYELAQKYYSYLPSWMDQPMIMMNRRIATSFTYLEYLYDMSLIQRHISEDGALEYWK